MAASQQAARGTDGDLAAARAEVLPDELVQLLLVAETQGGAVDHEVADALVVELDHLDLVGPDAGLLVGLLRHAASGGAAEYIEHAGGLQFRGCVAAARAAQQGHPATGAVTGREAA
ncbi:hypothetical protein D9M70_497130 [compost metagenome]